MAEMKDVKLTDDPLTNIHVMAPLLDENSQNKVFGLMCGLIGNVNSKEESEDEKKAG